MFLSKVCDQISLCQKTFGRCARAGGQTMEQKLFILHFLSLPAVSGSVNNVIYNRGTPLMRRIVQSSVSTDGHQVCSGGAGAAEPRYIRVTGKKKHVCFITNRRDDTPANAAAAAICVCITIQLVPLWLVVTGFS